MVDLNSHGILIIYVAHPVLTTFTDFNKLIPPLSPTKLISETMPTFEEKLRANKGGMWVYKYLSDGTRKDRCRLCLDTDSNVLSMVETDKNTHSKIEIKNLVQCFTSVILPKVDQEFVVLLAAKHDEAGIFRFFFRKFRWVKPKKKVVDNPQRIDIVCWRFSLDDEGIEADDVVSFFCDQLK